MPGRLGKNLRKGHLAEDIGQSVLRGFSAVADTRNQDDIGLDSFAVLLFPKGKMLYADATFCVQFKTININSVSYDNEETNWYKKLELPLFFSRVDTKKGIVHFYTTTRWYNLPQDKAYSQIEFNFETEDSIIKDNVAKVGMDPPIFSCTEIESRTDEFAVNAFDFFSEWIKFEMESIRLRRYNIHVSAKWSTGNPPQKYSTRSNTKIEDRKRHLIDAKPVIEKLAFHALGTLNHDPRLLAAFVRIFEWYKEEGINDDDFDNSDIIRSQMKEWEIWKQEEE